MVPASDGLPQSLFEALACETPVVLGRLPAYAEVVTDGESALFADRDSTAIAAALTRLLGSTAQARALAAAGRRRMLEVAALPREVSRVLALYEWLSAQGTRRPPRGAIARGLDIAGLLLR
jgi:glycosyltransferase involved in cell wall biosynthesis